MNQNHNTPDFSYLMLAQSASSDAPVLSGQGGDTTTGTTGAPGDGGAAGAGAAPAGPNFMVLLIPAIGFLLLMSIMGVARDLLDIDRQSKTSRAATRRNGLVCCA